MAKTKESQLRAASKWDKTHKEYLKNLKRRYQIVFNKEKDAKVIEKMDSVSNKNDYVRSLVLNDIKNQE